MMNSVCICLLISTVELYSCIATLSKLSPSAILIDGYISLISAVYSALSSFKVLNIGFVSISIIRSFVLRR